MTLKIDGHTHTELCPHGSGEPTAQMIERAIKLGFDEYHITEHAPLPQQFIANYGGDPENVTTAKLLANTLTWALTGSSLIGSMAVNNPQLTKDIIAEFGPAKVVVGVGGQNGRVATEGWLSQTSSTMADLIAEMAKAGAKNFVVTDVSKDGTMKGPNTTLLAKLQGQFPQVKIIASGGIRDLDDIRNLQGAGLTAMIAGKSIYEGTLTLEQIAEVNNDAR